VRAFNTLIKRYLEYYYGDNQKNIIGLMALYQATTACYVLDFYLFKNKYNRKTIHRFNTNFISIIKSKELNKQELILYIIEAEKKLPYIYDVLRRLEEKTEEEGYDTDFNPGKWGRLILATEVIDN